MRILAISDKLDPDLHGPGLEARAAGVDAVISCGDLPFEYLEYLVTFLGVPLFYVLGNHDPAPDTGKAPGGCTPLDFALESFEGFTFAGLSGCAWYSGGPNQYTERQMMLRTRILSWRLSLKRLLGDREPIIFVSHAAPRGLGDGNDTCHRGFETFNGLLLRHSPTLWFHGHVHLYGRKDGAVFDDAEVGETTIVNAYGYRVLEV